MKNHITQKRHRQIHKPYFAVCLIFLGFLSVVGSIGALEVDNIGVGQMLLQILTGVIIASVGFIRIERGGFQL